MSLLHLLRSKEREHQTAYFAVESYNTASINGSSARRLLSRLVVLRHQRLGSDETGTSDAADHVSWRQEDKHPSVSQPDPNRFLQDPNQQYSASARSQTEKLSLPFRFSFLLSQPLANRSKRTEHTRTTHLINSTNLRERTLAREEPALNPPALERPQNRSYAHETSAESYRFIATHTE